MFQCAVDTREYLCMTQWVAHKTLEEDPEGAKLLLVPHWLTYQQPVWAFNYKYNYS